MTLFRRQGVSIHLKLALRTFSKKLRRTLYIRYELVPCRIGSLPAGSTVTVKLKTQLHCYDSNSGSYIVDWLFYTPIDWYSAMRQQMP